jgi:membrane protein involved in colicin uptake
VAAPDANAELRRDYEYAERVGTKEAWESFLKTHANSFYADLARAQLSKLNAEQASTSATEKAKKADEEKARLTKEGASQADQAKADGEIKAAQKAKRDAETARKREQARVADAERRKKNEEARVAAQSKAVSLPARATPATPGWGAQQQQTQQPKAGPRLTREALWAKCESIVPRAGDDNIARPRKIDFCVANGGRY